MTPPQRLGRIAYLNVLPVYHALEAGYVPHTYELVARPPADLNRMMDKGELDASATSSIEYARNPAKYRIVPNLSIASDGEVMSVLLLSRRPLADLGGETILASTQSHTSVALLHLLLEGYLQVPARLAPGNASEAMRGPSPPEAALLIGDDALRHREDPAYPYRLDLGAAWREWTGLPFVFGLWVVRRDFRPHARQNPVTLLHAGRDWGLAHKDEVLRVAAARYGLSLPILERYFTCLSYALGERERQGLRLFYDRLTVAGHLACSPPFDFWTDQ